MTPGCWGGSAGSKLLTEMDLSWRALLNKGHRKPKGSAQAIGHLISLDPLKAGDITNDSGSGEEGC